MENVQRALLAAEAALFFALVRDSANDQSPPPKPALRGARRAEWQVQPSATCDALTTLNFDGALAACRR